MIKERLVAPLQSFIVMEREKDRVYCGAQSFGSSKELHPVRRRLSGLTVA